MWFNPTPFTVNSGRDQLIPENFWLYAVMLLLGFEAYISSAHVAALST